MAAVALIAACVHRPVAADSTEADDPTSVLQLIYARSLRSHGLLDVFPINVPLDGTPVVDPRRNGVVPRMVFGFDGTVAAVDGAIDCGQEVIVTNGNCTAANAYGSNLIVEMKFVKNACVTISLRGFVGLAEATAVRVLTHEGNVNADHAVNLLDLQAIKNALGIQVNTANFYCDVTADGTINILDLQAAKNNLNQPAVCP